MFRTFPRGQCRFLPFAVGVAVFVRLVDAATPTPNPSPTPKRTPAARLTPGPTGTPFEVLLRTTNRQGEEEIQRIQFPGNVSGDVQEFLRQQEAMNPAPPSPERPPVPGARMTPAAVDGADHPSSATARRAPDDAEGESLYRQAQDLFRQGRLEEGRRRLKEILLRFPGSRWAGEAHVSLGRQYEHAGNYESAALHLKDPSVDLLPEDRRAQAYLAEANALIMLGRFAEAQPYAQKGLSSATNPARRREAQTVLARLQILGKPAPPAQIRAILQEAETPADPAPQKPVPTPAQGEEVPSPTPAMQTLDLPKGRVIWIDFFETRCPHCEQAYPTQVSQTGKALDDGVVVYWIGTDPDAAKGRLQPPAEIRQYLERFPRRGLVAVDAGTHVTFDAFAGQGTPWTVLIDRAGLVQYADVYNLLRVRDKLTQLLGEDKPASRPRPPGIPAAQSQGQNR